MGLMRKWFSAFLLVCVVLALGDAPYVDEFLDDLAAARAAAIDAIPAHPHPHRHHAPSSKSTPGSSRVCQNLLNLYVAPRSVQVSPVESRDRFPDALDASFSSASLRRIDRPPAPFSA